jgi:hypothetical protein
MGLKFRTPVLNRSSDGMLAGVGTKVSSPAPAVLVIINTDKHTRKSFLTISTSHSHCVGSGG